MPTHQDFFHQAWRVWDGKTWTAQPSVKCLGRAETALTEALLPPPALLLEGGRRLHPEAAACLGWYNLVAGNGNGNGNGNSSPFAGLENGNTGGEDSASPRRINRRAVWKHATHDDRFMAFDGVAWLAQEKANLGKADGWLELFDAGCVSPDCSRQVCNIYAYTYASICIYIYIYTYVYVYKRRLIWRKRTAGLSFSMRDASHQTTRARYGTCVCVCVCVCVYG